MKKGAELIILDHLLNTNKRKGLEYKDRTKIMDFESSCLGTKMARQVVFQV